MDGLPILIGSGIREVYGLVADATEYLWLVIHSRGYITTGNESLLSGVPILRSLPFSH
jgi:hypothetical protein